MVLACSLTAPLFVPANRPDRFAKAAASEADAVIIDLEDAVPEEAKDAARDALSGVALGKPVIVRINAANTPWHDQDCALLARLTIDGIVLPKAERVEDLARLQQIAPVIAMVETARGLANARAMAGSGAAARLAFGSIDYAADIGCDHSWTALLAARSELVLASRLASLPAPLDGVTADLASPSRAGDDAGAARSLGFGGKLAIHPNQAGPILAAFRPTGEEIAWARKVLSSGDGVARVGEMMVDEPVRMRARAILARAER